MQNIEKNLNYIKQNIKNSTLKIGKLENDITLLGVTKTIDTKRINILKSLGISNFGENKAQELLAKYNEIDNCNWHFIGNLQTNKVKQIIDKVSLIHSVDTLKLAKEINKRAAQINKKINILIEINIANEPTKNGIRYEEADIFAKNLLLFPNISLKGLMCVAPFVENPQDNRYFFKKMKNLFIDINEKNKHNICMEYLSMGMTNDYPVAIEEGANIIRIGTGIFGKRNY